MGELFISIREKYELGKKKQKNNNIKMKKERKVID